MRRFDVTKFGSVYAKLSFNDCFPCMLVDRMVASIKIAVLCFNCCALHRALESECFLRDLVINRRTEVTVSSLVVAILKNVTVACNQISWLTFFSFIFQLHPKRPLRSEVEKEKRHSRPPSVVTPTLSIKTLTSGGDTNSIGSADSSSNRNSIITNDSTTSEEDLIPPPLPMKTRDSDYSNLPLNDSTLHRRLTAASHYVSCKPLPPIPTTIAINSSYDVVEMRNNSVIMIGSGGAAIYDERKRPPTPPPKPARNSKA